jgi:hypothetical protein
VKTIQLALVPFQLAGALQDRLRSFIDRSVRAVPEDRRISPAPQILGPVIEGIKYEPEGTPLDELFASLLASSMDSARSSTVLPAFPAIIRQLSSDEALILTSLKSRAFDYVTAQPFDRAANLFGLPVIEVDGLPREALQARRPPCAGKPAHKAKNLTVPPDDSPQRC